MRFVLSLFSIIVLAGCYAYTPTRPETLAAGAEVRAHLTGAESDRIRQMNGLDVRRLEGEVLEVDDRRMVLGVPIPMDPGSGRYRDLQERVVLNLGELTGVEIRERDRVRTGLAVGGAAALAGSVLAVALAGESGGDDRSGPPPPNEFRIPLIRFLW